MDIEKLDREKREWALSLLREKERRKCANEYDGFLRFIEKYCYIEAKENGSAAKFELWPAQHRVLPDIFGSDRLIMLKARQLGMTWLCAAYCLWLVNFQPMKLAVVISAKGDWAVEFLDRVYFMFSRLPEWLQSRAVKQNSEIMSIAHLGGNSTIKSLPTTEAGAQSKTPDLLILDESCWNPYVKEIYNASKPGIDAAGGRIIIISNSIKHAPGWAWTRSIFTGSMSGENDFKRIFMPWWDRPGRPDDFIQQQIMGGMDPDDAREQYPETETEAISSVTGSYFGKALLRHTSTMDGVRASLELDQLGEYNLEPDSRAITEFWRFPYWEVDGWDKVHWSGRYCIGSDISEGLGQDYSVAYVYDRLLQEFVCRMRSNRIDAHMWADKLHHLSKYYGGALICAERTGAGITTVKRLADLDAPQYVQLVPEKTGSQLSQRHGWAETAQSKHELCGDLKAWISNTMGSIYCSILLDECSTFIRTDSGKLDHEDGKHSDCVIAAGCAIQADIFIGDRPKRETQPDSGWVQKWKEGKL